MTGGEPSAVVRDVRTLFSAGAIGGLTDRQLLERFAGGRDDSAHAAFAALVDRHGAMVWGVCRRILADPHEAADAFQATFLVLVRRAGSVRVDDSLGRWLYGVSRRVAARARKASVRRPCPHDPETLGAVGRDADHERADLLAVLDEEIDRLPERYRAAVVLCDLGGLTHEEAALRLDCAVGTIGSRVARGREKLRTRLTRRGLAPSAGTLAATLSAEGAGASVPARLAESTVRAVVVDATGHATIAGTVSATVVTLAEGVGRSMMVHQLKWAAVALVTVGLTAGGSLVHAIQRPGADDARGQGTGVPSVDDPRGESAPPPTETTAESSKSLRDELDLLKIELARKNAEYEKAQAQKDLAVAVAATNKRLNMRRPGMVSQEELRKNEAEVMVAKAQSLLAQVEIDEVKLRIKQLENVKAHPELLKGPVTRRNAIPLERRMSVLEQKVDLILDLLKSKLPGAPGELTGPTIERR